MKILKSISLILFFLIGNSAMAKTQLATFAGGCFWCMQPPYDVTEGVIKSTLGYTGGHLEHPTYEQVSQGDTGHTEAIQIEYNPDVVSYEQLLDIFWRNVDPFSENGQFCDRGYQYRAEIFYADEKQKIEAEASKTKVQEKLGEPVVVEIEPAAVFYPAEDYHQDYYKKNPVRYKFYRTTCGRDKRLKEVWE